jgi:hypothetical protein
MHRRHYDHEAQERASRQVECRLNRLTQPRLHLVTEVVVGDTQQRPSLFPIDLPQLCVLQNGVVIIHRQTES